jgi:hypothetical protein
MAQTKSAFVEIWLLNIPYSMSIQLRSSLVNCVTTFIYLHRYLLYQRPYEYESLIDLVSYPTITDLLPK